MSKALQTMEWMTPGANLNAYIQGTATVPMLSVEEERSLGEALYYEEDLDAARRLVCLLYTSPSPRDVEESRMPSSA